MGALAALIQLHLRQMASGRKLQLVAAALLLVAGLGWLTRFWGSDGAAPGEGSWPVVYVFLLGAIYLQALTLLVPLLFATSLLRDEVEEGTMVYLATRPLSKPLLVLAKFAAMSAVVASLLVGGIAAFQLAFRLGGPPLDPAFPWGETTWAFARAAVLGVVGYGALFTLVGLLTQRALIFGMAYGFVSELLLTNVPAVVQRLTLMRYLRSVALAPAVRALPPADVERLTGVLDLAEPGSAALVVTGVAVTCLALAALVVSQRELHGRGQDATAL